MSSKTINVLMFVFLILAIMAIVSIQFGYGLVYVTTRVCRQGFILKRALDHIINQGRWCCLILNLRINNT